MVCQRQNCWCDIRKLWAPWGSAWMMSTVCVIIMLSPQAPMGVLPQRQHSPWWARTITSFQPVVTVDALMCQCVNSVKLPIFQSVLTFHCLLFFFLLHFFFPYSLLRITIHLPFQNAGNVNDMQQLECRLHKLQHYTVQNWHIMGHITNLTSRLWVRNTCMYMWR